MFAFIKSCVFRVSVFVCLRVCVFVCVYMCVCVCVCVTVVHLTSIAVKLHPHALGVWVGPQPCFPSLVQLAHVFQLYHLCVCARGLLSVVVFVCLSVCIW